MPSSSTYDIFKKYVFFVFFNKKGIQQTCISNISIYQALRGSTGGGGGGSLSPVVSAKTVTVNDENIKAVNEIYLDLAHQN